MKPQSYGGNPRRKKEFLIQYEKAENPFAVFEWKFYLLRDDINIARE